MFEQIYTEIRRFLGFLGVAAGSLTAITAIFTGAGYLAERSHLDMLGFPGMPLDLNQYIITGAKFFAYLPITFIIGFLLQILPLLILIIILVSIILLIPPLRSLIIKFTNKVKENMGNHRTGFLFLLIFIQLYCIYNLFIPIQITNLLFKGTTVSNVSTSSLPHAATKLVPLIINNNDAELIKHMGWFYFSAFITIVLIWWIYEDKKIKFNEKTNSNYRVESDKEKIYAQNLKADEKINCDAISNDNEKDKQIEKTNNKRKKRSGKNSVGFDEKANTGFWEKLWLGVNIMLIATQIILLPSSYGILVLPNNFPVVSVTFNSNDDELIKLQDGKQTLLYRQGDSFYLYTRNTAKIWHIEKKDIRYLVYHGRENIFNQQDISDKSPKK